MHAHGVIAAPEPERLLISGIQHFAFCPRQWALIHIEGQWAENLKTVEGELLHAKCHDASAQESRGDTLVMRGLMVFSNTLKIQGACDVVEFRSNAQGVSLSGKQGLWLPYPVEYKRGKPKEHEADELQLCAQAMCLEEMLCCEITEGALFYGEIRRRSVVSLTPELRERVRAITHEMHRYFLRGYTPKVKPRKSCANCSLKNICLPGLEKKRSAAQWVTNQLSAE